jgi:hypothetical protein
MAQSAREAVVGLPGAKRSFFWPYTNIRVTKGKLG